MSDFFAIFGDTYLPMSYILCTIDLCTMSNFPWHTYLPKNRTSFMNIPKTRYQKMVKIKDIQFCVKNLKMREKKDKKFLTFRSGDLNPRFSVIFLPMIWILMEGEGDKIKLKKALKRDRHLSSIINHWCLPKFDSK